MGHNRGFTLIEIIVTLMLVSILAAVAGFGIVEVARSYASAKESSRMAQTAQIALFRISRELMELKSVDNAGVSEIAVTTPNGDQTVIGLSENSILLDDDTSIAGGEILIDGVDSFEISYKDFDDEDWEATDDMDLLARIDIRLKLSHSNSEDPITFTTSINPRNNGTYNAPY